MDKSYVLGIDIGTTSVKVALVSVASGASVSSQTRDTHGASDVPKTEECALRDEQDVHRIITALQICVSKLGTSHLERVASIAVSGQMHGVVMWRGVEGWTYADDVHFRPRHVSSLVTWQDQRCSRDFLASLPPPKSHLSVSTGYGCATLFWLHRNAPHELQPYSCAGTVADYVVAMLCGLAAPVMTPQNAASWGYFDTETSSWNTQLLEGASFPTRLLPPVVACGDTAGTLQHSWYGIPSGTPVFAALGDMQCSVRSAVGSTSDAVMNVSTSAQVCVVMPAGFSPDSQEHHPALTFCPYTPGRYLGVAASLNGGNVLKSFVRMLRQWTHDLTGYAVPEENIWNKVTSAAESTTESHHLVQVKATLHGERYDAEAKASVTKIGTDSDLGLGAVYTSLCRGLADNLAAMMGPAFLQESGASRIVGTGSALLRSPPLQAALTRAFAPLPLTLTSGDAALGVALAARDVIMTSGGQEGSPGDS